MIKQSHQELIKRVLEKYSSFEIHKRGTSFYASAKKMAFLYESYEEYFDDIDLMEAEICFFKKAEKNEYKISLIFLFFGGESKLVEDVVISKAKEGVNKNSTISQFIDHMINLGFFNEIKKNESYFIELTVDYKKYFKSWDENSVFSMLDFQFKKFFSEIQRKKSSKIEAINHAWTIFLCSIYKLRKKENFDLETDIEFYIETKWKPLQSGRENKYSSNLEEFIEGCYKKLTKDFVLNRDQIIELSLTLDKSIIIHDYYNDYLQKFPNARKGQSKYRQQLINYVRSLNENLHLFSNQKINKSLLEACHILPHNKLTNNEKLEQDYKNGVLLDPSLHRFWDNDYFVISHIDGTLFVKNDYKNDFQNLFFKFFSKHSKFFENLSPEQKQYLKKRNEINKFTNNESILNSNYITFGL